VSCGCGYGTCALLQKAALAVAEAEAFCMLGWRSMQPSLVARHAAVFMSEQVIDASAQNEGGKSGLFILTSTMLQVLRRTGASAGLRIAKRG
jgi:hypothetical protein